MFHPDLCIIARLYNFHTITPLSVMALLSGQIELQQRCGSCCFPLLLMPPMNKRPFLNVPTQNVLQNEDSSDTFFTGDLWENDAESVEFSQPGSSGVFSFNLFSLASNPVYVWATSCKGVWCT